VEGYDGCAVEVHDRQDSRIGRRIGLKCRERSVVGIERRLHTMLKTHKRRKLSP
jgi:hypothetical protein